MLQNKRMSGSRWSPQTDPAHEKRNHANSTNHKALEYLRPPQMIILAARAAVQYEQTHPNNLIITVGRISQVKRKRG